MKKKKLVQFGAGNIGRSFVGQLFSAAGYEVVFVDVDKLVVEALNHERTYRVEVRDRENRTIEVENVRAVDAADQEAVLGEIVSADICATAVGPLALPRLFPVLAGGLKLRRESKKGALNLILCENLRDAAAITRQGLRNWLPTGFPLDRYLGLVETSIGKMAPIIAPELRRKDPLTVYAEAYNTLILDRNGFIGDVPEVEGLDAKDNMKAYVDRKSFVHNLGHAALAYFGHLVMPEAIYTWEVVEDRELRSWVKNTMLESGRLLIELYPGEFSEQNQEAHIEDLLDRFGNRILGDTIHRVGRDLKRKLRPEDRVVCPLSNNFDRSLPAPWTALTLACGLFFLTPGPEGGPLPGDLEVMERVENEGPRAVLEDLCRVRPPLSSIVSRACSMILFGRSFQGCLSRRKFLEVQNFIERELNCACRKTRA